VRFAIVNYELEHYLASLESALSELAPSQRAELVLHVKKRIEDMQANQGQADLKTVLQSYGEPFEVAERLVAERGIDTNFRRRFSWSPWRWALSGLVTVITVGIISILFLIKTFTPFFEIDEQEQRLRMFGGAIDIPFESKTMHDYIEARRGGQQFNGNLDTVASGITHIKVQTTSGSHDFAMSNQPSLSWDCRGRGDVVSEDVTLDSSQVVISFKEFAEVDCSWLIPSELELEIKHDHGLVVLREPTLNVDLSMSDGKVMIKPASDSSYDFDLQISNGMVDPKFRSRDGRADYLIKVRVINGMISSLD